MTTLSVDLSSHQMTKKNIGITDRIIRFVVFDFALGIVLTGFDIPDQLQLILVILGLYILFTVITGFSMIYKLFGYNTIDGGSSPKT